MVFHVFFCIFFCDEVVNFPLFFFACVVQLELPSSRFLAPTADNPDTTATATSATGEWDEHCDTDGSSFHNRVTGTTSRDKPGTQPAAECPADIELTVNSLATLESFIP